MTATFTVVPVQYSRKIELSSARESQEHRLQSGVVFLVSCGKNERKSERERGLGGIYLARWSR
jgi:hypothetical protein